LPKYRNSQGKRLSRALFLETSQFPDLVVFTLKDEDYQGHRSLRRLYLEAEDISEYRFVNTHLDGWDHWQELTSQDWFAPLVAKWRSELHAYMVSKFEGILLDQARGKGKEAQAAARYLLERAEKAVRGELRGRPRKGSTPLEISHQRASQAEEAGIVQDDLKRIGIS